MSSVEGTAARTFDFEEAGALPARPSPSRTLRLAPARLALRGPDKYRILEQRRRRAQIEARRQLHLLD